MNLPEVEKAYIKLRNYFIKPRSKGAFHSFFIKAPVFVIILLVVMFYCLLAVIFSKIYITLGLTNDFIESFIYSFYVQTTLGSNSASLTINNAVHIASIIQVTISIFYTSIFIAIFIYKLINITPQIIMFEKRAVFSPNDNTLRIRIVNRSKFSLVDVKVYMILHVWIEEAERFATIDINLKRNFIHQISPYTPWNIATKPIDSLSGEIDLKSMDISRKADFHPNLVNLDLTNKNIDNEEYLVLLISSQLPVFSINMHFKKSYKINEIVCGKYRYIITSDMENWGNWGRIDYSNDEQCRNCLLRNSCELKSNNKR